MEEEMIDELDDLTEEEIEEKANIIKGALRHVVNEFNDHGVLSVENVYYGTRGVDVRRMIQDFNSIGWTYGEALDYMKSIGISFIISPTEEGYVPEATDNKYYHNYYAAADRHEGKYELYDGDEYPTIFMSLEFFEEEDAINVCKEALLDMIHDTIKDMVS